MFAREEKKGKYEKARVEKMREVLDIIVLGVEKWIYEERLLSFYIRPNTE